MEMPRIPQPIKRRLGECLVSIPACQTVQIQFMEIGVSLSLICYAYLVKEVVPGQDANA